MTEPSSMADLTLNINRVFSAPPETMFGIWTEPELMKRWFSPEGFNTIHAEVDLRVGGHYRIGMQSSDGNINYVSGTYREIDAPRKLVFTWAWSYELFVPHDDDMLVTIHFIDQGKQTEIKLTHEHLKGLPSQELHASGWQGCLDKLSQYLSQEGMI